MNRIVLGLVVAAALVMVSGTSQAQEHFRHGGGGSNFHHSVSRGNGPGYSYRSSYTHRNFTQPRSNYHIPPAYYRPNFGPSCNNGFGNYGYGNYGYGNYGYGGGSYYRGYNSYYRGYSSGIGFSSGGLNIYYGF